MRKGSHYTPEQLERIIATRRRGHHLSQETKNKILRNRKWGKFTPEMRERFSDYWKSLKGKSPSSEVREKISQKLRGIKRSPEVVENIKRGKLLGKKRRKPILSEQGRQNIINANRGRKCTPEQIENMRRAKKGTRPTEYVRECHRKAITGKKQSPETIAKRSKAMLGKKTFLGKKHKFETKMRLRVLAVERMKNFGQFKNVKGKNETALLDAKELADRCSIIRSYEIKDLGYVVDGYCKETNTVYEVYETGHKYKIEKDSLRQNRIQEHLKCDFIIIYDGWQPKMVVNG